MRESSTYQAILEEGRAEGLERGREQGLAQGLAQGLVQGREQGRAEGEAAGLRIARSVLLAVGSGRWGDPAPEIAERLQEIHDLERLQRLTSRAANATRWEDLLA